MMNQCVSECVPAGAMKRTGLVCHTAAYKPVDVDYIVRLSALLHPSEHVHECEAR